MLSNDLVNKIISTSDPFTLVSFDIMQKIAMDSTGPLPKDANGNEYLVSIIDHFLRFVDLSAKTSATCLLAWFHTKYYPIKIKNSVIQLLQSYVGWLAQNKYLI